jgi:hypothetical protein
MLYDVRDVEKAVWLKVIDDNSMGSERNGESCKESKGFAGGRSHIQCQVIASGSILYKPSVPKSGSTGWKNDPSYEMLVVGTCGAQAHIQWHFSTHTDSGAMNGLP